MSRRKKRGYKAFDPFCNDKVRVALYNRPNGPHMGKLVMGKTYLSGLDGKCFSRTGRIKKGYRNVPIDLQREFEIEKRQIKEIRDMIRGPTAKQRKKRAEKKQQQKAKRLAMQQQIQIQNNSDIINTNNKIENENTNNNLINNQNNKKMVIEKPIQSMKEIKRLPNESFNAFEKRVKNTAYYQMNHKEQKKKLKWKEKRLEKKMRKIQQKVDAKRQRKLEHMQKIREQKQYERKWTVKKEYVPFGATNAGPPEDLHALGARLFKKKGQKGKLNENNVNVGALSFANVIKNRAEQMKKEGIMRNYAVLKQKRWKQRKAEAISKSKNKKRNAW